MFKKKLLNQIMRSAGLSLLAATSFLGACSSDEWGSPDRKNSISEEDGVVLNVTVPGIADGGRAATRSVTEDDESTINDLYVLAFEEDGNTYKYQYFVKAYEASGNTAGSQTTSWVASLKVSEKKQVFAVIANAEASTESAGDGVLEKINALTAGDEKSAVLAKLTTTLTTAEKSGGFNTSGTGKANHRPFTMYGETAAMEVGTKQQISVDLHRIMARVQVKFSASLNGFTPKEMYLYNYNDKANVGTTSALDIPSDAQLTKGPAKYTVANGDLMNDIYLFETPQPTAGTESEKHSKRPCIVVGGYYNGSTDLSYYRVDFYTPDNKTFLDIRRNHSYAFTVNNVKGKGQNTPEEAFNHTSANIETSVLEWNDSEIGNVDFDGEKFLGLSNMKYELGRVETDVLIQKVRASSQLEWKAVLYGAGTDGSIDLSTTPDWIHFCNADKSNPSSTGAGTGTGTGNAEGTYFTVETYPYTSGYRKAFIRYTAGNLLVDVEVIQDYKTNPVFISTDVLELEFADGHGWANTSAEPSELTKQLKVTFGPDNTELTCLVSSVNGYDEVEGLNTPSSSDGANTNNTVYLAMQAAAMPDTDSSEDYKTRASSLVLTVRNKETGETTSKTIRLVQKKYGVKIVNPTVYCTGEQLSRNVLSNFMWQAESSDTADGLIESFSKQNGMPTDMNGVPVKFQTTLKEGDFTSTGSANVTFKNISNPNISVEVPVSFKRCFYFQGVVFEAQYSSWNCYQMEVNGNSGAPSGFALINAEQAKELARQTNKTLFYSGSRAGVMVQKNGNTYDTGYSGFYSWTGTHGDLYGGIIGMSKDGVAFCNSTLATIGCTIDAQDNVVLMLGASYYAGNNITAINNPTKNGILLYGCNVAGDLGYKYFYNMSKQVPSEFNSGPLNYAVGTMMNSSLISRRILTATSQQGGRLYVRSGTNRFYFDTTLGQQSAYMVYWDDRPWNTLYRTSKFPTYYLKTINAALNQ